MFPGGISGKQLYIYKNTSDPLENPTMLDICEVEIWGIYNVIVLLKYIHMLNFKYIVVMHLKARGKDTITQRCGLILFHKGGTWLEKINELI